MASTAVPLGLGRRPASNKLCKDDCPGPYNVELLDDEIRHTASGPLLYGLIVFDRNGKSWQVLRRYTAFADLHATLSKTNYACPSEVPPAVPQKRGLRRLLCGSGDEKRGQLQDFMGEVLADDPLADSEALRIFLELPRGCTPSLFKATTSVGSLMGSIQESE